PLVLRRVGPQRAGTFEPGARRVVTRSSGFYVTLMILLPRLNPPPVALRYGSNRRPDLRGRRERSEPWQSTRPIEPKPVGPDRPTRARREWPRGWPCRCCCWLPRAQKIGR